MMDENYKLTAEDSNGQVNIKVKGVVEIADSEDMRKELIQKMKDADHVTIELKPDEDVNLAVIQILLSAINIPEKNISVYIAGDDDQIALLKNAGLGNLFKLT